MSIVYEDLTGTVYIDDIPGSLNKAVKVTGAITAEHALSVASQAVTQLGLDGEWGHTVAKVGRDGPIYTLTLKPV